LPPYIARQRTPDARDKEDYQTIYAQDKGSVAAPTAGLHFTPDLLNALRDKGVEIVALTLHVGAGTFLPVKSGTTDEHIMHSEWFTISEGAAARINKAKDESRRVIAVGTTALRALESAIDSSCRVGYRLMPQSRDTDIFITPGYEFKIARTGVLKTARGDIRTPAFMPVGTAGTVKGVYMDQVRDAGADIILGNTYHLMLRPGAERVKRLGGLHKFGGWDGPILTDSGGFQVWSLSKLRKMSEQGVEFQSHHDGSKHMLSPERSIEIQADLLGADISMQLDECTDFPSPYEAAAKSMELSLRWGQRSLAAFGERDNQTFHRRPCRG